MAQEFCAHSDHEEPDKAFEDLHQSNFILACGWVACQKIRQLNLDPYPWGLLARGLDKFGDIERGGQEFLLGLEYLAVVGTTVMVVMADVNEQALKNDWALELVVDAANGRINDMVMDVDLVVQNVEVIQEDMRDVFQQLRLLEERVEGFEQRLTDSQRDIVMLVFEKGVNMAVVNFFSGEWEQMNKNLNNLGLA